MKKIPLLAACLAAGFFVLSPLIYNVVHQKPYYNGKINYKGGEEIQNQPIDMTQTPLAGYASKISVFQGEKIKYHVSANPATNFTLFVYREGGQRTLKATYRNLSASSQNFTTPEYGLGWPSALEINIPQEWESGLYYAQITPGNPATPPAFNIYSEVIPFIVKEDNPGETSRILFQLPTNTWLAYNNRMGRDFYTSPRTFKSSFLRPIRRLQNIVAWIWGTSENTVAQKEVYYLRWLEQNGYKLEFAANHDIEDKNFLSQYNLFISAGHDEYWSKGMRNNLEEFTKNGGNVLFASSNSVYYQVRFEDNYDTVTTYKLIDFANDHDPMIAIDPSRVAIFWSQPPVNRPENSLTGVGYRYGGVGKGGYTVYRTNLWPFAGTGLYNGAKIGENLGIPDSENTSQPDDILAKEVDATPWMWGAGGPVPKDIIKSGTPQNFQILGVNSLGTSAPATMGMYEVSNGGTVFTFGTWDWWKGLFVKNAKMEMITKNIMNRLKNASIQVRPSFARETIQARIFQNGKDGYLGTQDTHLDQANPTQNFENNTRLKLGNNKTTHIVIKYNLESLPQNTEISFAQLSLHPLELENGSEIKAALFEPSASWSTDQATWQRNTINTFWPNSSPRIGPFLESEIIYQTGSPIHFDTTSLVQRWVNNPGSNNGVLLTGYTQYYGNYSQTNLYFASSHHATQAFRPSLTIHSKGTLSGISPTPTPIPTISVSPSPTPSVTPTPPLSPTLPPLTPTQTPTPTPTTSATGTQITISARGYRSNTNRQQPKLYLYLNSQTTTPAVMWTTTSTDQNYTYISTGAINRIDVVFPNQDYVAAGNTTYLVVNSINKGTTQLYEGPAICIYDKGSLTSTTNSPFDNNFTIACQHNMYWNGSLRLTNF